MMEDNPQVLDVSYGNFSCRLEGFEDSVETMKLVVSFFHELAGHDRFMDTEPLAPDLATLARLTQEQTGVPVDIEGQGNQVSLRVKEDTSEDSPEVEAPVAEPAVEAAETEVIAEETEVIAEETTAPAPTEEIAEDKASDASYAQNLSSIVATKLAQAAETQNQDADEFIEDLSETVEAAPTSEAVSERLSGLIKRTTEQDAAVQDAAETQTLDADETQTDLIIFNDAENAEDVSEAPAATQEEDDTSTDAPVMEADGTADATAEESADDDTYDFDEAYDFDDEEDDTADTPALDASEDPAQEGDAENDDAEFDLEAEVAKVEAEIAARHSGEFDRPGLPRHVEDAMSRIMSQTDQHLNQPENRRHRDAFAQLKAAVAATEAARQLGDKGADKSDPDEVYKDDLGAHEARVKTEIRSSTPPLKLVKSQEVKPGGGEQTLRQPEPAAPAASHASDRLRQIATQKEATGVTKSNEFSDFVAFHDATDLTDQLEAAGAYICFIDGDADFSRPQVMKLVQSLSEQEITREDGLRSFGRLLRQARLIKLPNGRFQVSENTQYRPDGYEAARG